MKPPIDLNKSMVSISEACALAGVSRRTIYNWIRSGKVEWIRTAGGHPRIFTASLFRTDSGERLNEADQS